MKQHIAEATENPLQWMVVVVENEFAELTREALEFRVAIRNERGLISLDSEQIEHLGEFSGSENLPHRLPYLHTVVLADEREYTCSDI